MSVRSPRAWLQVDGHGLIDAVHIEVSISRTGIPGSYRAVMSLDHPSNPGEKFWSSASPIKAAVIASNGDGSSGLKALIRGDVTIVEVDWNVRSVVVQGNDAIGNMLDTRSDQLYPNMTASNIVSQIAGGHSLRLNVDATEQKAGTSYDGGDYAFLSDYENQWDVIQSLARSEGKIAFVNGDDFHFVDPGSAPGGAIQVVYEPPTIGGPPSLNGMTLRTWRNVPMANIAVKTTSYHPYDKQPYVGEYGTPPSGTLDDGSSNFGAPPSGNL